MNGIDGQPIHWETCYWDKWASLHYRIPLLKDPWSDWAGTGGALPLHRSPELWCFLQAPALLVSDRNLFFCFVSVWTLFNWKQTSDYLVFKDFPGLVFRCREQIMESIQPLGAIAVFISECKHFPHASVIISDTGVFKETKVKYYNHTLMKIYLFNFALGGIMTATSRLLQFPYIVLYPDFTVLQGDNEATLLAFAVKNNWKQWQSTVPIKMVRSASARWAPPLLSSLCWLQQSVWKAFLDDKSAQRSIYCHTEFTDCLQHGRHIPPALLFLQPYKHWPGFV